jgi:hypothetical protein
MCDPTVLAIGSTVAGLAGKAVDYFGQQSAADEQKKAYDDWAAQQAANRAKASALDEQNRQQADVARAQGLQDVSAESQKTAQQAEQDRLTSYLQGSQDSAASNQSDTTPTAISDTRLSGQQGGDATFQSDLTSKLGEASADAKKRIAALAAVGSYGGSYGGLDNTVAQAFQKSGEGIDLANDFRKGNLAVYNTEQAVNPLTYTYTKSPISGLADTALSVGSQGLGKMLANSVRV